LVPAVAVADGFITRALVETRAKPRSDTLTWKETTMNIVDWLLQTDSGVAGLLLRITLAVVMFPHGAQKRSGDSAATASRGG
jgi:hypothetical protein